MERLIGLAGIAFLLGVAYLLSNNRKAICWKTVIWGVALQMVFALAVLKLEAGQSALAAAATTVRLLVSFADRGAGFVFGPLAGDSQGYIFAFKVLPIVIFFSSFFTVLYHLGLMQLVVRAMARVMTRFMGVSGSESLAAAANVFVGMTEAPLLIAPYIPRMTYSELMALMTGGMATVAGSVLGAYIGLGVNAEYLIGASIMAAPASLLMAKMLIPETEASKTAGRVTLEIERRDANIIEAAARGAGQGVLLAINIAAMLIAFIALVYLVNAVLTGLGGLIGLNEYLGVDLTLQLMLGYLLAPVTFLMGVPWRDAFAVGQLVGLKLVINEFVAYVDLVELKETLDAKSELIATYALCGFANFGSVGVQLGGIGGLAPDRKSDLAKLGLRAMAAGAMATLMTATFAGMLA